jgi:twinkle protein
LPSYSPGDRKILCPKCSHQRRNKADPCLSVHVDPDGENACWMCHNCDWRGSTTPDDKRIERPRRRPAPPPPRAVPNEIEDWFARRGIGPEVVRRARIGYDNHYLSQTGAKTPCIAFPYARDGELVNVKYRSLAGKHFAQAKGGMQVFYGLDDLVEGERIIIVEGEVDKLTLDECGLENALSVPDGAPARLRETVSENDAKFEFLRHDAEKIRNYDKIVIAVDNDGPGNVLAEELSRRFGTERCYRVRWPDQGDALCKDANETLIAHGAEVVRECIEAAEPYPIRGYHPWNVQLMLDRKLRGIERAIGTGWAGLDQYMTIAPGQLTVVTGIPNHGKSEFVDALVVNLAMRHDWRFAMCSFENSIEDHQEKLAEKYLGIPFDDGPMRQGMTASRCCATASTGSSWIPTTRSSTPVPAT